MDRSRSISGNERKVEAEDAVVAEDVPGLEHRHEALHHRRAEGKGEGLAHQDHQICGTPGGTTGPIIQWLWIYIFFSCRLG